MRRSFASQPTRSERLARFLVFCAIGSCAAHSARAVEMKPETAACFDRYVQDVEARMDDDARQNRFLAADALPEARRRTAYQQMQSGQPWIEQVPVRENGKAVAVPSGMIHHWRGAIFIPRATLQAALAVLTDYDRHKEIYKPRIRQSKLIARSGDESRIHLQLFNKSVVTVYLNADFDVTDTQFGPARYQIALRSTHIAEVLNPETPDERELPEGNDHGYLWRFRSYWRIEEKDGGVYAQNESVALSRSVPAIFAWLFNPFIRDLPRDVLLHLLTDTRDAVMAGNSVRPA